MDGNGNVYVAGESYDSWGSPQRAFGSGEDAFAAKLDSKGQLVWNTFLGGAGYDGGRAIAVDGSGNAYVAGFSTATWGSPQRAIGSGEDAFAAKLDNTGQLVWNNFLSSTRFAYAEGRAIAVDGGGNIYVSGMCFGTWGSPLRAFSGGNTDGFAAKLDSLGQLVWNTFLGGGGSDSSNGIAGEDEGNAIAVDGSGNIYVSGISRASWGSPLRAFGGGSTDGFAAMLDSTGTLVWNTFLGVAMYDQGRAIAVDGGGNVYVTGHSGYAAKLDNSIGQLVWNTSLGGTGLSSEKGNAIAVDGNGNVYVAGFNISYLGGWNSQIFVAKLANGVTPTTTTVTANANLATYGQTVTFTASVSGSGGTPTGTVTFRADGNAITGCGTNGAVNLSNGSATCVASALTAAGSPHAITAAYSGDANNSASNGSLAGGQTVKKANASVTTWPAASAITYGQTLASATLSGGAATPAGGFAFTSPVTKPSAGTAAQSVTYTPTETGN